jgi:hypothetical protein
VIERVTVFGHAGQSGIERDLVTRMALPVNAPRVRGKSPGAGAVRAPVGLRVGGADGFPWNQPVWTPKAASAAKAMAAIAPVRVLGTERAVRERVERRAMGEVRSGRKGSTL